MPSIKPFALTSKRIILGSMKKILLSNIIMCILLHIFSLPTNAQDNGLLLKASSEQEAEDKIEHLNDYFKSYSDNKVYFNGIYLLVMKGMSTELDRERYERPECMRLLTLEFVNMYLDALDKNASKTSPLPWKEYFNLNHKPTTHLLLGMNAHISYDLPISMYRVSKKNNFCLKEQIKEDYFKLNFFFKKILPELNLELKNLANVQSSLTNSGLREIKEYMNYQFIMKLRKEAWMTFTELVTTKSKKEFESKRKQIEIKSLRSARELKSLNFLMPTAGY